jgi:hypothetical protein
MHIPIIRIWELADLLEQQGHQSVPPKNGKLGIAIYEDPKADDIASVLIPGIIQRPSIGIESAEDFFKELQKELELYLPKIGSLFFLKGAPSQFWIGSATGAVKTA